jgi:polar amino acid transport system permease protein
MDLFLSTFLNFEILRITGGVLLNGLWQTLLCALLVIPLGALAGLALAMLCVSSGRVGRTMLPLWIDLFRSLPPLVLLIYIFYGVPLLGYEVNPYVAIAWAFTLNTSSYFAEIFRAGIESIPQGQWQAARACGMGWMQTFLVIILPQGVRTVLPDLLSNVVTVTQLTALASVVGVHELLHAAQSAQGATYNVTPLVAASLLYLIVLWPLVRLVSHFEARLRRQSAGGPVGYGWGAFTQERIS